ncbi:threonylcarbamoyl-AMP synthase [Patescibacteria group bacterium]|nr:threonylcarbamoyl-AMP synthase [Patescibacteria group bacterium]
MIVLYPTDTIYGLGVDATDAEAVSRLFELKGRNENKPISIVVSGIEMMRQYAEVTPLAEKLTVKFLPGRLTIVLKAKNLPDNLTAGTGTVGVRIPNHPVPLRLVRELGKPITATSANVADQPTLSSPKEIRAQFAERAGMITEVIDEGVLPDSLPSTVVDARGIQPIILREGAVPAEAVLGNL